MIAKGSIVAIPTNSLLFEKMRCCSMMPYNVKDQVYMLVTDNSKSNLFRVRYGIAGLFSISEVEADEISEAITHVPDCFVIFQADDPTVSIFK